MLWGVNIHPEYTLPIAQQLALAKSIGFGAVRTNPTSIAYFQSVLAAAASLGMTVLPVLTSPPFTDNAAAYAWGQATGASSVAACPGLTWEIGNELDLPCLLPGINPGYGVSASNYDSAKFAIALGLIQGLLAGVRTDPTARAMVNAVYQDYGFLDLLHAAGVACDLISSHVYMPVGTTGIQAGADAWLGKLKTYGAPLAITEFNQQDGHLRTRSATTLIAMATAIANDATADIVQSAYVYELLDQPGLAGGEATYGLANAAGTLNSMGVAVKAALA